MQKARGVELRKANREPGCRGVDDSRCMDGIEKDVQI